MSAVLDSLFEWHVNGFNIPYFVTKKEHFVAVVVVPVLVIVVIVGMMVLPMILQQYNSFFRNTKNTRLRNDGNFWKRYQILQHFPIYRIKFITFLRSVMGNLLHSGNLYR